MAGGSYSFASELLSRGWPGTLSELGQATRKMSANGIESIAQLQAANADHGKMLANFCNPITPLDEDALTSFAESHTDMKMWDLIVAKRILRSCLVPKLGE